jgi:hypothetical protein
MMDTPAAYEALAEAFLVEGVDTLFTLIGDANLHFGTALAARPALKAYLDGDRATVWDMRISDRVPVPKLRKAQARHRAGKTNTPAA